MIQVLISCFNIKYPDFKWDESAQVPKEWRWGDPDPDPTTATPEWVSKYALLLLHGSGPVLATELPYKVTRVGQSCKLIVERPANAPPGPVDVLLAANEWVGVVDSGALRVGKVRLVSVEQRDSFWHPSPGSVPAAPTEGEIGVDSPLKNMNKTVRGCTLVRSTVRPPRKPDGQLIIGVPDVKKKFLAVGIASLDATALFELLAAPAQFDGFRGVLEGLPGGAEILDQLRAIKNKRNELAGHLVGGAVPTHHFAPVPKALLTLITRCESAGLVRSAQAAQLCDEVRTISAHEFQADRHELIELYPSENRADAVRKSKSLIKRFTAAQYKLFNEQISGSPEPSLLVQSPPGSGKTLICQHLALRFLVGRLNSPTADPRRLLLLTHSTALAKVCARYIETVARE